MTIDKRKFTSLFDVLTTKKFKTNFVNTPEFNDNIQVKTQESVIKCISSIQYLTSPIIEAADYCSPNTVKKLLEMRVDLGSVNKTFLYVGRGNDGLPSTYETQFINFEKQKDKTVFHIFGYTDTKKKQSLSYFILGYFNHSAEWNVYEVGDFSYLHTGQESFPLNSNEQVNKFLQYKVDLSIQFEIFLQYSKIETKILKPHHKDMDGVLCRYENKLPSSVSIINSTWFTNLIKSDAFKVRGHFRLQPYGHGLNRKKLIWINEFQKEGYTREAKIIKEHPSTAGTL